MLAAREVNMKESAVEAVHKKSQKSKVKSQKSKVKIEILIPPLLPFAFCTLTFDLPQLSSRITRKNQQMVS